MFAERVYSLFFILDVMYDVLEIKYFIILQNNIHEINVGKTLLYSYEASILLVELFIYLCKLVHNIHEIFLIDHVSKNYWKKYKWIDKKSILWNLKQRWRWAGQQIVYKIESLDSKKNKNNVADLPTYL